MTRGQRKRAEIKQRMLDRLGDFLIGAALFIEMAVITILIAIL